MPKNKYGHNRNHDIKKERHYKNDHNVVDSRTQQERLVKFQQQQEKKRIKEENRFRAQQGAQRRAQEEAQRAAARQERFGRIWDRWPDVFAPNFNRHQEQNNRPFVERDNPVDQDNGVNPARFVF